MKRVFHNCFKYAYSVDDGMIYDTEVIQIEENDYICDLQNKALEHIKRSSVRLISDIQNGAIDLKSQPTHPFITFPALNESSGEIFPKLMSCNQSINLIRSCSRPFPGAYLEYNKKKFRVWTARLNTPHIKKKESVYIVDGKLIITLRDGQILSDDYELIR